MSSQATVNAAIAAHRFGLGETSTVALQSDPQGWLLSQIGPADGVDAVNHIEANLLAARRAGNFGRGEE